MKRKTVLMIALAALLLALPMTLAGPGHEKCKAGTQDCLNKMAANLQHKGIIGVEGDWDEETSTYKIHTFLDGSQAKAAGLRLGDRLTAVNGISLGDGEAAKADKANRTPGSIAKITVTRDGQEKHFKIKLIALSEEQIAKAVGQHMIHHAEVKMAMVD